MASNDRRARWEERYRSGPRPWDTNITPPEVVDFWRKMTPDRWGDAPHLSGVAVDIGCGTGTNAVYLAGLGLTTVGVDLSRTALHLAQDRRKGLAPPIRQRLHFAQADGSCLPFAALNALYVLDIGCFHAIPAATRFDYANGVIGNLAPGGYFHLYAFDLVPEEADATDPRGLGEKEIEDIFTPALSVVEIIRARPDRRPCRWYLLRKR